MYQIPQHLHLTVHQATVITIALFICYLILRLRFSYQFALVNTLFRSGIKRMCIILLVICLLLALDHFTGSKQPKAKAITIPHHH